MYKYYGTNSLIGIKIRQLKPEKKNIILCDIYFVLYINIKFYLTSQNEEKSKDKVFDIEVETILNYYLFSLFISDINKIKITK